MASLFKSTTSYDPIFALLNAETEEERDRLTEKWRDHKLEELNFVGIVVCLEEGYLLFEQFLQSLERPDSQCSHLHRFVAKHFTKRN